MAKKHHIQEEQEYLYQGPVYHNDHLHCEWFEAVTYAVSTKEAWNNIKAQYKARNGLEMNSKITLAGNLILHETSKEFQRALRRTKKKYPDLPIGQLTMRFDDEEN